MIFQYRALVAAVALALVTALPPTFAAAQPKTAQAASPSGEQRAIELYQEGRTLLSKGKASLALPKLVESLALLQSPNTELLVAHAHRELGHKVVALETYERVATNAAAEIARGQDRYKGTKDEADRWSRELSATVATLRVEAPAGAQIEVPILGEGVRKASGPTQLRVEPGEVKVRCTISGTLQEQRVQAVAGAIASVKFLAPEAIPSSLPSTDESDASVSVPGIIVGSVGLAALGVSIGFGVSAQGIHDGLEPCLNGGACPADFEDQQSEGVLHRNLSNGMFGAGIGLVAVGATIWIIQAVSSDDETAPAVPPAAWLHVDVARDAGGDRVPVVGIAGTF